MQRDDSVYLKHRRDAFAKIQAYTKGIKKSTLLKEVARILKRL